MEQAQYDQILILGKKYMSEKKQEKRFKKEKKKGKGIYTKIFTVVVSGCWEYRLFCFAYMSCFLLFVF